MAYAYTGTVFAAPLAERAARPSLFMRIIDALAESRRHAAQRQINARAYLFQDSALTIGDLPKATLATDSRLPFAR
jgi:hypothetical protein